MENNILKGVSLSLLGYFFIAMASVCVKLLPYIPTTTIIFFQFMIGLFLTLPKIYLDGWQGLKTSKFKLMLIRCATGLLSFTAMFFAIKHIPIVNAVLLQNTVPLFVPFVMLIWLKKWISPLLWLGIIVGFLGVILILKPHADIFNSIALIGLSAGVLSSVSAVSLSLLKKTEPTNRILFYFFFIGSVVNLPWVIIHWTPLNLLAALLLLASGILIYFGFMLVTHAFLYARPIVLAPLSYATVVFTGLFSWMIWGEMPDKFSFLGILLVIMGGIMTILLERQQINAASKC